MDYYNIGQRIRKYRKALGYSQEELAEKVDISLPHMSHIETGNTKLSLPVLVTIAEVLQVSTDSLLFDARENQKQSSNDEIQSIMETCSTKQAQILSEIVRAAKVALDKYE